MKDVSQLKRLINDLENSKSAMHVYGLKSQVLKYLKGGLK